MQWPKIPVPSSTPSQLHCCPSSKRTENCWRYSRPAWTRSCAACCRWPWLGRGVGLDDPQRSLPTPTILWFCEVAVAVELIPLGNLNRPTNTRSPCNSPYLPSQMDLQNLVGFCMWGKKSIFCYVFLRFDINILLLTLGIFTVWGGQWKVV